MKLTAVIFEERFSDGSPAFIIQCPELNITTQGTSIEHARAMLKEAVEGVLKIASPEEIARRIEGGGTAVALLSLEVDAAGELEVR